MSADDPDSFNRRYHAKMREEIAEANTPQARGQAVLDRWWSEKFGPSRPDAISDYSPVARACRELDDRQADADRHYRRGL
jgi:hypothetical protein